VPRRLIPANEKDASATSAEISPQAAPEAGIAMLAVFECKTVVQAKGQQDKKAAGITEVCYADGQSAQVEQRPSGFRDFARPSPYSNKRTASDTKAGRMLSGEIVVASSTKGGNVASNKAAIRPVATDERDAPSK